MVRYEVKPLLALPASPGYVLNLNPMLVEVYHRLPNEVPSTFNATVAGAIFVGPSRKPPKK